MGSQTGASRPSAAVCFGAILGGSAQGKGESSEGGVMAETVRDVMTTDPATCSVDDTARDAAVAMSKGDFGAVVVVGDGGEVRGIVTDRDIVVRGVAEGKDPSSTAIGEVFTTEP